MDKDLRKQLNERRANSDSMLQKVMFIMLSWSVIKSMFLATASTSTDAKTCINHFSQLCNITQCKTIIYRHYVVPKTLMHCALTNNRNFPKPHPKVAELCDRPSKWLCIVQDCHIKYQWQCWLIQHCIKTWLFRYTALNSINTLHSVNNINITAIKWH